MNQNDHKLLVNVETEKQVYVIVWTDTTSNSFAPSTPPSPTSKRSYVLTSSPIWISTSSNQHYILASKVKPIKTILISDYRWTCSLNFSSSVIFSGCIVLKVYLLSLLIFSFFLLFILFFFLFFFPEPFLLLIYLVFSFFIAFFFFATFLVHQSVIPFLLCGGRC